MGGQTAKELSVVLPCRNEEQALDYCLKQIEIVFQQHNINGEIIVSDSSSDSSPSIAKKFNTVLVKHDRLGYGAAYLEGFKVAKGEYLFLADADATYDFHEIPNFLEALKQGHDFVIGNRFLGTIEKGSMPWAHRFFGNPFLSSLLRLFFGSPVRDVHCGMRALSQNALVKMNLQTTGMEFASEMVIRSAKSNLKIKQLPISYYKRRGHSKLRPLADGWRHLRFMLLYSPLFLFFIPGVILFLIGGVGSFLIYFNLITFFGRPIFYHPLFLTVSSLIIGYQLMIFAIFSKTYAMEHLGEYSKTMNFLHRYITIEKLSFLGGALVLFGLGIFVNIFWSWVMTGFDELQRVRGSLLALVFLIIGTQAIFSSFMLSILSIKNR